MPTFLFVFKRNIEIISAIGHKEDSSLFVSLLERILLYSYLQDFLINLYSYFRTRQSDIIYIRKINSFAYLSLITDAYSYKVIPQSAAYPPFRSGFTILLQSLYGHAHNA